FCNGVIDVVDKHLVDHLYPTRSQLTWVNLSHLLGYFLIPLPAAWIAIWLGYRGGIISGLLLVCLGSLCLVAAACILQFWTFILGVSIVAAGLAVLETVANPYAIILGNPRYAATRINAAQT